MIAFAARYGHQDLIALVGEVSSDRLALFCKWVGHWIDSEHRNGSAYTNRMAEGG